MQRYAMWVPGYSVIAQNPDINRTMQRVGGSAIFDFGDGHQTVEEWFHFPIPTPTRVQSKPGVLARVMILFVGGNEYSGPWIQRVDVWDGGNGIGQFKTLIYGDHGNAITPGQNIIDVNRSGISWGVGVSLLVHAQGGVVRFVSAGADFDFDV